MKLPQTRTVSIPSQPGTWVELTLSGVRNTGRGPYTVDLLIQGGSRDRVLLASFARLDVAREFWESYKVTKVAELAVAVDLNPIDEAAAMAELIDYLKG